MDIIAFSEELQQRLKAIGDLDSGEGDLLRLGKAVSDIREIISELKQFTVKYSFRDVDEEVQFFKEVKPVFLSQYTYYRKMFSVLFLNSFQDREGQIHNYYKVLKKLQAFAVRNQAFYEYCMSGATYLDQTYFTRRGKRPSDVELDDKFSTGYDLKLSKILAHELMKENIIDALRKLRDDKAAPPEKTLTWTDSKVSLIELIYALHTSGVFNHGKIDLKQIVRCFEEQFSVELGNYARVFSEIRIRKSGQTNFLEHLRERLERLIEDMD